jgi:hypothetical protein
MVVPSTTMTEEERVSGQSQIPKNNSNDHHDANDVEDIHPNSPQRWTHDCLRADVSFPVKRSTARKVPREAAR